MNNSEGSLNSLWFTDTGLNEIGRMAQDGSTQYYPIPSTNAGLAGITEGPDGALWFVESMTNNIGRLTTDGSAGGPAHYGHGKLVFTEAQAIGIMRL